jgi:hypothetical protein
MPTDEPSAYGCTCQPSQPSTLRNGRWICDTCDLDTDPFADDERDEPVATTVYERVEMGGSVHRDLRHMTSIAEMEDYFSDADPAEFL